MLSVIRLSLPHRNIIQSADSSKQTHDDKMQDMVLKSSQHTIDTGQCGMHTLHTTSIHTSPSAYMHTQICVRIRTIKDGIHQVFQRKAKVNWYAQHKIQQYRNRSKSRDLWTTNIKYAAMKKPVLGLPADVCHEKLLSNRPLRSAVSQFKSFMFTSNLEALIC
jgi:hypothetical protein